jgi:murein DD-endopeptidase MepM/ murein hydrolase activator NlpD
MSSRSGSPLHPRPRHWSGSELSPRRADYGTSGHSQQTTPTKPGVLAQGVAQSFAQGYALIHAGRQVRVGPVLFWIIVGTIIVMTAWSASTAIYFAFRDDVLTRLVARQAEMQYAYEDRISDLRAQVDRATSRQLLDQEQFEKKLAEIQKRQATLEQRTTALSGLPDASITGSIRPTARSPLPSSTDVSGTPKPSPINDTVIFVAPPDREARLESRATPATNFASDRSAPGGMVGVLARMQMSLDGIEGRQRAALNTLEESYDSKMRRMRGVFSDLGLDMAEMQKAAPKGGIGGPFVPLKPASSDAFDRQLFRINVERAEIDRLSRTLSLVPYRKPVIGEIELSSGFGVRTDPFLGRPAMHTGLDFRASMGDPVRVTANGTVTSAGWSGGYGRMVEVDHGNGLSTRYGHLSEILVKVGQPVKIGEVIGAVGSTGRSTGPHLHYETRIDGEAVDPQKFLRAGVRLTSGGV